MGDFKYQIALYNLFDYIAVERHLEKMAARGWRLTSIGKLFWIYKKAESAKLKYSVTYIPEVSQFDPEPLEKQKDIEAYCEEVGWEKVDNWLQMQIFCSENPDAVPIETEESLRLEMIHKSVKKNLILSHVLLLMLFLWNVFIRIKSAGNNGISRYGLVLNNRISFLVDGDNVWSVCICISEILLLSFGVIYYLYWYKKAKQSIRNGQNCPEPKAYKYVSMFFLSLLLVCICGIFSGYSVDKAVVMLLYLILMFVGIHISRNIQERMKWEQIPKHANMAITLGCSVVLCFLIVFTFSDVRIRGRSIEGDIIVVDGVEREVWHDTYPMPLYAEDFVEGETLESSRWVPVYEESFLAGYGVYLSDKFFLSDGEMEVASLRYDVITVKTGLLYDFMLNAFYDSEFRYAEEEEREKTEYRMMYESEQGTMYRKYYDGLPKAKEWLVLTEDKIVPMRIHLDDLNQEQMKIILEKFSLK